VSIAAGLLSLLTGIAYTGLGAITAYELARHSRDRGHSHFGFGFLLMAATCGPHHLVHSVHFLFEGRTASAPLLAALAIGFPSGALFVGLRFEALLGGRGDRFAGGTPMAVAVLPWAIAVAAGATGLAAVQVSAGPAGGWGWAGLTANAFLCAAYLVTGWIVFSTQVARRPGLGGWSISGLAMAGVFVTCGLSHLVAGLTTGVEWHTLMFDLPGVPAAAYFLWAVHGLHRSSLNDWNRRPLVGRAGRQGRPAPWAA
jgi:hypothetical protein